MNKLMLANMMRLKKNKVFWFGLSIMLLVGIMVPIVKYNGNRTIGVVSTLDSSFLFGTLVIGVILSVFSSIYIGTDYSDGTLRNKIITGYKRWEIYLSNLFICIIVSVLLNTAFMVSYLIIGIPLLGFFKLQLLIVCWFVVVSIFLSMAFASIFTLISITNSSKASGAISCILITFLLLISGIQFNKMLNEPLMNRGISVTDSGQKYDEIPNPNYIDGNERNVVQFMYDFLPGGQVIQCITLESKNLKVLPLYSIIIIIISSTIGIIMFNRKELK